MDFLLRFFKKDKTETTENHLANTRPEDQSPYPKIRNDYVPHSLDLGWHYSENKNEIQMVKIPEKDRSTHFYVIGATGAGKTKFLEFLISQDIEKANGFGVIDPHGDLIEDIKGFLSDYSEEELTERVVLIDPTEPNYTITFNPLERLPNISMAEQASELVVAFKKIWTDSWGVRMEDLMRNSLIALGEAGMALSDLPQFFTSRALREIVLKKISHPVTLEYFKRFNSLTNKERLIWIEPVMNKVNAFLSDDRMRQIFSSPKSSFNIREIMDSQKMLLVKLDKGKLKDSADLLGSLLMAKIQMAAFSRSDIPQNKRKIFYLYVDEFQNFASESFAVILSEARKYRLSLIMAHQTLSQIPKEIRDLILGNAGIQVYFRINRQDAELLAKEGFEYSGYEVKSVSSLSPIYWGYTEEWEHKIEELQNLPPRICYIKHKIEGGIIPIQTPHLEQAEFAKSLPIGRNYLISRESLFASIEERQKLIKKEIEAEIADWKQKQSLTRYPAKRIVEPPRPDILLPKEKLKELPKEYLSPDEKGFMEFLSKNPGIFVSQAYAALELSGYKGDKIKESLIEKGFIIQQETRDGKGGRLAKVLNLTDKGAKILEPALSGKGGDNHKYLQITIKEQAELFGWKAVVEQRISGSLESVDVGLARGDVRAAIEISSTSKVGYEIQNIRKCLDAGYDYILCISYDEKRLSSIKTEARKSFTAKERERIRFYPSSQIKTFFQDTAIVSEKAVVSGEIPDKKQLLDTTEASEFLGISKNTLYEWVVQKKIPYVKVGRLTKFKREALEAWLNKRTQGEERRDFSE